MNCDNDSCDLDIERNIIFVPRVPDRVAQERVHAAIAGISDDGNDISPKLVDPSVQEDLCARWPICCQVKINTTSTADGRDESWILTSLDSQGNAKTTGGDEFYITYSTDINTVSEDESTGSNSDKKEKQPYSAVALIEDRQDGTYRLDFCATPTSPECPQATERNETGGAETIDDTKTAGVNGNKNGRGGTLTVFFQYSCGIGRMPSPTKQFWTNGGYTHRRHDVHLSKGPPIRPFVRPNSGICQSYNNNNNRTIDLNDFDLIVAFGDSTMEQLVRQRPNKKGKYYFQSNICFGTKVTFGLNTSSVSQFMKLLEQGNGKHLRTLEDNTTGPAAVANEKCLLRRAVMVGSGLWDILDSKDAVQGATNPDYEDHRRACRDYIRRLRRDYPDVYLLWKSPTAVHIHVVNLERLVVSKMGEAALFGIERLRYMSASRSKRVYEIQKQVVFEEQQSDDRLFFLDLYEASYLSADWLFPSDGRHYRPDLNRYMLQWFYPSSQALLPSDASPTRSATLKGNKDRVVVSSDEKGSMIIDNIPKPYYVDPTLH